MAKWTENIAKGDQALFERVLGWRGIDLALRAGQLATMPSLPGDTLPAWIGDYRRMVGPAAAANPAGHDQASLPAADLSLSGLVAAAVSGPASQLGAMGGTQAALAPLERRLLVALTSVADQVVTEACSLLRACEAFPVLARLLSRVWSNWIDAVTEMLDRLAADHAALAEFLKVKIGPATLFEVGDADSHDEGRMVVVVTFESGDRVVYKPRDMRLDVAFGALVDRLCEAGLDLGGTVPRTLARSGYGWASFVGHRYSADATELAAFWQRAGELLGVLTALGGSDMHGNNVIACGDRLALIDLETVLTPPLAAPQDAMHASEGAVARLVRQVIASPLRTVMLPTFIKNGPGNYADLGALSASMGSEGTHRAGTGPVEAELLQFHSHLLDGFKRAMEVIQGHKKVLTGQGGALDALAPASIRFVFRNTALYARLLKMSCTPEALRDGADRDVLLEQLARMLAPSFERPVYAPIVDAEKRALQEFDTPRFELLVDGCDLRDADGVVVPGMFEQSALEGARLRVEELRGADIRFHCQVIGLSLQARIACSAVVQDGPPAPEPATALAGAAAIAEMLRDVAVAGDEGDLAWLCPQHDTEDGYLALAGFNLTMLDGTLGIALFLAALARIAPAPGTVALRDGALAALRPNPAATGQHRSLAAPRLGLVNGLGGEVWGFTALARLGGPAWCLEAAATSARTILSKAVRPEWSLATGTSGALAGLLALHAAAPDLLVAAELRPFAECVASQVAAEPATVAGLMTGRTGAGLVLLRAAERLDVLSLRRAGQSAQQAGDAHGAGWGEGAAGVAHARGQPLAPTEREVLLGADDSLWRGKAGLLAIEPGNDALARALAGHAVARTLCPVRPKLPGVVMPGLMNGVAGVGYALLRHHDLTLPDLTLFD